MGTSLSPIILKETAAPATPPSGHVVLYSVDGSALLMKDDAGAVTTFGAGGGSGTKISDLPAEATLTGAELVPIVQSGVNERTTAQAIANLAPSGSGDMVLASAQTVTGIKTFADGALLMRNAAGTVTAEPYSDVNPPQTILMTDIANGSVATPAAGLANVSTPDGKLMYIKDSDGVSRPLDMSWENIPFSISGVITAGVGTFRYPIKGGTFQIETVAAMVSTAPTGGTLLTLDVNKNSSTIYGTQANRPIFAASSNAATVGAHTATTVTDGDYITVDVDSVGSTVAGSNLVLIIRVQRIA